MGSGGSSIVAQSDSHGSPIRPQAGSSILTSAVFVSIAGLTTMDGPTAHATISALHRVLREALLSPVEVPGIRVLSCLTGAIILVPDEAGREVADLFAGVASRIASAGIAVRAGIAHGQVELLEDADGTLNAVGVCLNIAARLAYAKENAGLLVHESYADHSTGILSSAHWLYPSKRSVVEVAGKRTEVFRCFAAPSEAVEIRADSSVPPATPAPAFVNAVLLAYDLPSFSDGDARELASRFRSIVQEVRRMRDTGAIPHNARFSFSPGGDGAVLALTNFHVSLAHTMAEQLEHLLDVETSLKAKSTGVRARIGLHYGPVFLFESAEGALRPTGTTLFDADALAGDAEAKKHDAVIVSGAVIDLAAHGSRAYQRENFEELGALPRPHGRQVRRFVRRTRAMAETPPQETPGGRAPTKASLRKLFAKVLPLVDQLDALCVDHFSDVALRFTSGMSRDDKENLLLQMREPAEILEKLREKHPEVTARHEELLKYG